MISFDFYNPTHLLFGSGKLSTLHASRCPGKKALLLISTGKSTKETGSLARTEEQLSLAGVSPCDLPCHSRKPLQGMRDGGGAFARGQGCDFIVALGGGAVLDASVAVAAMATNPGDPVGLCIRRYRQGPAPAA